MTNIKNSIFCSHIEFMCFVWIWEQATIISLFSINWLLFISNTECVYCAVKNDYLYIIQKINSFGMFINNQTSLQEEKMSVWF